MLSITDLRDFIDLDIETLHLVSNATRLPPAESAAVARQLLASEEGIITLHHMYRDEIAAAAAEFQLSREKTLRQAYNYFSRKYPIPQLF